MTVRVRRSKLDEKYKRRNGEREREGKAGEGARSVSISEVLRNELSSGGTAWVHRALVTVPCNHPGNYRHLAGHE